MVNDPVSVKISQKTFWDWPVQGFH